MMKRIVSVILCLLYFCVNTSFAALVNSENKVKSDMLVGTAKGVYQIGQFMESTDMNACLDAIENNRDIIEYIHEGLLKYEEEIILDEFAAPVYPDDLQIYYTAALNNYPDLYFVSFSYQYYIYDDGTLASLVPIYTMEQSEMAQTQDLIDAEVEKACANIEEGMCDLDKIITVHDYFTANYKYDYKNLNDESYMRKFTIPALFIDKMAVCQGYGLGFQYVLNKLGVECVTVQSSAMSHLWNLVQLENGNWYHIDVTWDDPTQDWYSGTPPTMTDEEYELAIGNVKTYFMLSDSKIQSLSSPHYSYNPADWANDDEYAATNMFSVKTASAYYKGKWYYVDYSDFSGYIHEYNAAGNTDKVLGKVDTGWPYLAAFSDVCVYGGKLYYNTATDIMIYDPATGESSVYLSKPSGVGGSAYIYGMSIDGNVLTYTTAEDYLGTSMQTYTVTIKDIISITTPPDLNGSTQKKISKAIHTATGSTVVTVTDIDCDGVIAAVDYEDGRLVSIKTAPLAETVEFTDISADEIFVWKSVNDTEPLCKSYVIN